MEKTLETYEALIAASNIGTWELNIDTGFLKCNDIYFSMLGMSINDPEFSRKQNSRQIWECLLHPEDKQAAINLFNDYVSDPAEKMYENFFRLKHSDGSWVRIWSRGRFIKDESGKNTKMVIGTHTDVSAYKKAEEEVQMERSLLRTLIDSLPDVIYVKDIDGHKIISNHADIVLGNRSERDILGKTDLELFEGDIGLRGYRDDMKVIKTGKPLLDKEEFFIDKRGNRNWLLTSKVPVWDGNGKVKRLIGIGHNITERKKNEESLKEAYKKIKASNKMLLQIIWSNSHELRKPLCSILGLVDLLKQTPGEQERKTLLNLLEKSSVELDQIIRRNNEKTTSINSVLPKNDKF